MIEISNTEVFGLGRAIYSARNAMNSWDKSDSVGDLIGDNDFDLAMRLVRAGTDHSKFMRMITVITDIKAPLYVWSEIDTYKVGTVRSSSSFMHKGVSEPFSIRDFSVKDERIYEVLTDYKPKEYALEYPYETDEFRIFTDRNGRAYRVYRNGKVIREEFSYTDNYGTGRTRVINEAPPSIYQDPHGYFVVKLSGRGNGHMMLHRMVAEVWCDKRDGATQVNHIDGNKGNNCVENLEWVTAKENMRKAVDTGLYDNMKSLRHRYKSWKRSMRILEPRERFEFYCDMNGGMGLKELARKYDIKYHQASTIKHTMQHSEYEELFAKCYMWEGIIQGLNEMRSDYLETKDEKIFQDIRCLLPQGYLQFSTLCLNYAVLRNMYHARKNHRLDEWHDFCHWIESLPYSELITNGE